MLCAVALSASGIIPIDCAAYDTVWQYVMPMAAACFLLETDVRRLATDGGPVIVSFAVGAVGMVLGALLGWWLLREQLGPVGAKLAACLCASYVGGSVNFAAVALALQVPSAALPGAMAADNLLMAGFMAALMAVPVERAAAAAATAAEVARGATHGSAASAHGAGAVEAAVTAQTQLATTVGSAAGQKAEGNETPASRSHGSGAEGVEAQEAPTSSCPGASTASAPASEVQSAAPAMSLTLAAAAAACAVSRHLVVTYNAVPITLLIMAVIAAGMAAAAQWLRRLAGSKDEGLVFAGAAQLGSALMLIFFAVIGASAGSLSCLDGCGVLLPFLLVMVAVHWAVLAGVGRGLLRLPLPALLLGSNANIGGSATAAGMAAAKGWKPLVQPAMLAGSMGYAIGTAAGLLMARLIGVAT